MFKVSHAFKVSHVDGAFSLVQKPPLELSEVNLSCGDIFIIIKAITQEGANWFIVWAFV